MSTSELFIHTFRRVLCLDAEAKPLIFTPKTEARRAAGEDIFRFTKTIKSNLRERVHHLLKAWISHWDATGGFEISRI